MAKKKDKKIEVEVKAEPRAGMFEKIGVKDMDALRARIMSDFDTAEEFSRQEWLPERNLDVKAYFGIKKASEWPFKGASKISSQFHRLCVDTIAANTLKSIDSAEKRIKADPTNAESLDNAKYVEDLQNHQANYEYDLHAVLDAALPNALIESFTVLHPCQEYRAVDVRYEICRWVPSETPTEALSYEPDTDTVVTQDGQPVQSIDYSTSDMTDEQLKAAGLKEVKFDVYKEEVVKDGVSVHRIGASRFFMAPFVPGDSPFEKVQRAPAVMQQLYYTIHEMKALEKKGYFENVGAVAANLTNELLLQTKAEQTGYTLDAMVEKAVADVIKWNGPWEINGKEREVVVWFERHSHQLMRIEPNVFGIRPYFPLVPFPVDEHWMGESLCKILRPLVRELDLVMSMLINIGLMKAAPPKFYDPGSGFDPATVSNFGPNSWIPAREPGKNVLIPPQPEDPGVLLQMAQMIMSLIERITGVNEVVQGQISDRANTTATEVSQAMIRSGVRFDVLYDRIKTQMKPMFQYIHRLNLRYMPLSKEVQLMGPAGSIDGQSRLKTIHKGQLAGQFNFYLAGNSVVTEQAELQKAVTLFNTLGQHPYISYKPESIYYMLFNIVKRLNPLAMDKILPKPEEVAQLSKDRQLVQQEQEQAASQEMAQANEAQMQAQQQAMQMETQMKQAEMQLNMQAKQQEMQMKEQEHDQKLRQNEEAHQMKLKQMEEAAHAKAKEAAKSKPND